MILRPDRRPRGADPTLPQRMSLLAAGAALALAGMLWQRDALVVAAIVVLAIGLGLSVAVRRRAADGPVDAPTDDADDRPSPDTP